jgi:hypothetical protein
MIQASGPCRGEASSSNTTVAAWLADHHCAAMLRQSNQPPFDTTRSLPPPGRDAGETRYRWQGGEEAGFRNHVDALEPAQVPAEKPADAEETNLQFIAQD